MTETCNIFECEKMAIVTITQYCDGGCPYCIADASTKAAKHYKGDMGRLVMLLKELSSQGWHVEITGGEVSAVPGMEDFLNHIAAKLKSVNILSNGSGGAEFEKKLRDNIYICYTWHSGRVAIDDFYCNSERERTEYRYLLHPDYISNGKYEQDMKEFGRFRILSVIPYIGFGKEPAENDDTPVVLVRRGNKLVSYYNYDSEIYKGKLCTYEYGKMVYVATPPIYDMKKKYVCINVDGSIYLNFNLLDVAGDVSRPDMDKIRDCPLVSLTDARKPKNTIVRHNSLSVSFSLTV